MARPPAPRLTEAAARSYQALHADPDLAEAVAASGGLARWRHDPTSGDLVHARGARVRRIAQGAWSAVRSDGRTIGRREADRFTRPSQAIFALVALSSGLKGAGT